MRRPLLFLAFLFFSFWLMFHTFSYEPQRGAMVIATKAWSDFGSHIPLIRSFSLGENTSRILGGKMPEYPLFPGEPIRYHFLFYFFVGILEKMGLRIDWALNIPSAIGFFLLLGFIFLLSYELFAHYSLSLLSVLFFLFNGSLSFVRFFQNHTLADIFTNSQFPSFAPWGPGDISAFWNLNIYTNQRHLALAFALALAFIYTTLRLRRAQKQQQFSWGLVWGVLIGLLPFFHQVALALIATLLVTYFVFFPGLRPFFLIAGGLAAGLIALQLPLIPQNPQAVSWYPGYLIHSELSPLRFLSYWWQNLGLHSILIPVGFFFIPKLARKVLVPLFFIFTIANLFRFSVEVAASHKFFNFALLLGNMVTAYLVVRGFDIIARVKNALLKISGLAGLAILLVFLTLSGVIDFFAIKNDSRGMVSDVKASEAATWIRDHTPPGAVFLNSNFFFHPASLAGRPIFQGWPYFSWSYGYTEDRLPLMRTLYESKDPNIFCPILAQRHIDFVTVEDTGGDPNLPVIDVAYFTKTFTPEFQSESSPMLIFSTEKLCRRQ